MTVSSRYFSPIHIKFILLLFLNAGLFFALPNTCQAQEVNEKMVPVFIYNFTKYIEWPGNASNEFIIGLAGNTSTENFDKLVKANTINGRKIVVKKIKLLTELQDCQLVYIPSAESNKLKEYIEASKNKPILLVSSKAGLIRKGADISLFIDEEDDLKTKFEINKSKMESQGFKISKELLTLAYHVMN